MFVKNVTPYKLLLALIIVFTSVSCRNNQKKVQPKALEDKNTSYSIASTRSYTDLVEDLYKELATNNPELKSIEAKIKMFSEVQIDSIASYSHFVEKNNSYYNTANQHIETIKDSLIRDEIKSIVTHHLAQYNSRVAIHNELLKRIETNQNKISDLYKALKIIKTLPLIDQYQKDNLPGTSPFDRFIKQQEEIIKLIDKPTK